MQTENLKVTGMTCAGCTSNVAHALEALEGVRDVEVSLSTGEATVQYDEQVISRDRMKSAITAAGYGLGGSNATPDDRSKGSCCS